MSPSRGALKRRTGGDAGGQVAGPGHHDRLGTSKGEGRDEDGCGKGVLRQQMVFLEDEAHHRVAEARQLQFGQGKGIDSVDLDAPG